MVAEDAPERPAVKVFRRVPDAELAALYRSAWVFCLPSTYEGFGIPYVEAMASGCPVVATPNPGAREVTQSGKLGVISDEQHLGSELVRLLASRAERERLATLGLEGAKQYDLRMVARSYEALYTSLVRDREVKAEEGWERSRDDSGSGFG